DAWNAVTGTVERWSAPRAVVATPLFVAARLVEAPPAALVAAAKAMRHAPWLVANLQLDAALDDRPGAPPSWDNVPYGSAGLGYAMSIPVPGVRGSAALQALAAPQPRVQFAHADLSSYSVFEEAFFHGTRAGRAAAAS